MEHLEPIIHLDKPIFLVGMRSILPAKSDGQGERVRVIQDLSRRFLEKVPEIIGRVGAERYSIIENDIVETAEPALISVMVVVQSFSGQPDWAQQYTVLPGKFARFHHYGLPRDLGKTVASIYQNWAPKIPGLFASHLEVIRYPPEYDPTNAEGSFEYLLPLS